MRRSARFAGLMIVGALAGGGLATLGATAATAAPLNCVSGGISRTIGNDGVPVFENDDRCGTVYRYEQPAPPIGERPWPQPFCEGPGLGTEWCEPKDEPDNTPRPWPVPPGTSDGGGDQFGPGPGYGFGGGIWFGGGSGGVGTVTVGPVENVGVGTVTVGEAESLAE